MQPSLPTYNSPLIPIPAGCARFLCYGWIITGVCFVLGMHKGGKNLSGAGLMAIGLGALGLYVTRPRKD
jgi:hypothetical protein